jgi:arabinogalactan endo-1,4-beta-galactosidase
MMRRLLLIALVIAGLSMRAGAQAARTQPFILGADISWVPQDEASGAVYYENGVKKDVFQIFKDYRFNYVRLRLFVNPKAPGGYAARLPEAFCDLEHTKVMARRAKAAGMGILLDMHLGDTWTSPAHQAKPAAWEKLTVPQLCQAMHDYTHSVILALKQNETRPEMVEIGNEISGGILFPDGSTRNEDNFAALLKAGIAGVREVDPTIRIMLHHHLGRSNSVVVPWVDNLIQRGVQFDVIGLSCYAEAHAGDWKTNFDDLAVRYPDKWLVAAEYSGRKRELNDLVYNTPNARGLGTFIWEPTRWREALFDKDGVNAGGGGATNDLGQPLATAQPATRAATRPFGRRYGGRYDANNLFDLYPLMSKAYGN